MGRIKEMGETVSQILGMKRKPASSLEMALAIQKGLPAFTISRVCERLHLPERQAALALGVPLSALTRLRRSPQRLLDPALSDRLYRIANLFAIAASALCGEDSASAWLLSPQPGLGNLIPVDLISTEASAREVEDLLLRLEHGVLP
jgi:putative toxin-antitoxin system antitoxin component (TIGR02293 family)